MDRGSLLTALGPVTTERAGGGEFSQLVSNHFFGHIDVHMGATVMYQERMSDKLRGDR